MTRVQGLAQEYPRVRILIFSPVFRVLTSSNPSARPLSPTIDLKRRANQVRIVELHASSLVPIVPEYFQPGLLPSAS